MNDSIYRGYAIKDEGGELPIKVYDHEGNKVWAGHTEAEALDFVDRSKRELRKQ